MKQNDIYRGLKYYNDFKAVKNGRVWQRIQRRFWGRLFATLMRMLVK